MFSRSEDEVAIRFSHVDKTYRLFKNDRARFYSVFNKRVKASSGG